MRVNYEVVEHNGGWAYRVDDVYSETFATHDEALTAAKRAASEQQIPDETTEIDYQDARGRWHEETAPGNERPETDVKG